MKLLHKSIIFYYFRKENLALNKSTWQEHPWTGSEDYGSENAVDGLYTDRSYSQCTINADGYYTAEWRVDLGNVLNISYINIFYRTNYGSMLYFMDKKN